MANTRYGTSEARFEVEIDGIPAFKATKVSGGSEKHDATKIQVGNDVRPRLSRGMVEPQELQFSIPSGLYDTAIRALYRWMQRYNDGLDTTRKSGRYITYDETGRIPLETWEFLDCVPVEVKADDKSGDGKNAATVTVTFLPEKVRLV